MCWDFSINFSEMTTEKLRRLIESYKLINSDMIFALIETQLCVIDHTPYSEDYKMLLQHMVASHIKTLEIQLKLAYDIQRECVATNQTQQLLLSATPYLTSSSECEFSNLGSSGD